MDINGSGGKGDDEKEEKDHFSSWCSEDIMFSNIKMNSETFIVQYNYEYTNIDQNFSCFPFLKTRCSIDRCNYFTLR